MSIQEPVIPKNARIETEIDEVLASLPKLSPRLDTAEASPAIFRLRMLCTGGEARGPCSYEKRASCVPGSNLVLLTRLMIRRMNENAFTAFRGIRIKYTMYMPTCKFPWVITMN